MGRSQMPTERSRRPTGRSNKPTVRSNKPTGVPFCFAYCTTKDNKGIFFSTDDYQDDTKSESDGRKRCHPLRHLSRRHHSRCPDPYPWDLRRQTQQRQGCCVSNICLIFVWWQVVLDMISFITWYFLWHDISYVMIVLMTCCFGWHHILNHITVWL